MDGEEAYHAIKSAIVDAMDEGAGAKISMALPLKPFRASRTLIDDEEMEVNVVGMRFDPVAGEWKFVCIAHDSVSDIYILEAEELAGELPLPADEPAHG